MFLYFRFPLPSRFPTQQPQRVADHHEVRQAHGQRAQNRAHESQGRQRYAGGIVKERPEKILLDGAQRGARERQRIRHGLKYVSADRLIAAAFGVHAVELVAAGKQDRMVAWSNREVIDVAIEDAIASQQEVETPFNVEFARVSQKWGNAPTLVCSPR